MAYYFTRLFDILHPYLSVIKTAFTTFPFVAFLITVPYMIVQYKKFGSIPLLRTAVVYSFVLYCMTVYYLAILPLPTIAEVAAAAPKLPSFIPYASYGELFAEITAKAGSLAWFKGILKSSVFRESFFNVCMFFPLGIYLRYYFKAKFPRTVITGFLCSLFIELTQLSGLYFIYPHAYRSFDTTDLCNNTLGAVIGYALTPIICCFLPSRDKLDERAYKRGTNVPLFRRLLALAVDLLVYVLFSIALDVLLIEHLPAAASKDLFHGFIYVLFVFLYFILLQTFTHGQTLGNSIMKMRIVNKDGGNAKFWQLLLRYALLYVLVVPSPAYAVACAHLASTYAEGAPLVLGLIGVILCGILLCTFASDCLMKLLGSEHEFLYGRISSTKCVSTIEIPKNVEVIINSEKDGTKIYEADDKK